MKKIFTYLFIALVIFIILSATFKWSNPIMPYVNAVKYGDKIAHLVLIGTLAYCINYLMQFKRIKLFNRDILKGSVFIFILITLEEFSQIWISTRTFDLIDLSANYVGILIASLIIIFTKPNQTSNTPKP